MSSSLGVALDLSQLPALMPPPGVIPNFIDPYTRGPMLLALSAVAIGFMYLFLAVRFYSKLHIKNEWTWDDATCTLAALASTGLFVGLVLVERAGFGTHQWNVRASRLLTDSYFKPLYVVVITLPLVALFVKLTFYILFLRVFRPKKGLRWSIYIGIAVTVVFYTVTLIILLIWTTPKPGTSFVTTFVKFASEEKSPVLDTAFALGYFNIFSDTYILVLPISAVAGLNLPIRRKFGLSIVFMAGILAVCCSTVSLVYRYRINDTGDTTWNMMPVGYLTVLEHTIGIDCSCVPACSVAVRRHLPLLASLKSKLTSWLRIYGTRFTPSKNWRSRHLFNLGEDEKLGNAQQSKLDSGSSDKFSWGVLPKISKGMHQMRTARDFFWMSRNTAETIDEEENDLHLSDSFEAAGQV